MSEKLVVYDSVFGNTAKVAEAIGEALGDASVNKVTEVSQKDLHNITVLFVGSPTRAFRPTPGTMSFLKGLNHTALSGVKTAAFDTRFPLDQTESGFLRTMIKLFGYADIKISKALSKAGATLPIENAGFAVEDTEGPLAEGELERAKTWAKTLL